MTTIRTRKREKERKKEMEDERERRQQRVPPQEVNTKGWCVCSVNLTQKKIKNHRTETE